MSEHRRAQLTARIQTASPEQRGRIIVVLWFNALAVTTVNGGLAISLALSAARIWRRRGLGLVPAVRTGGYWPAVVGFTVAATGLRIAAKPIVERIIADGEKHPSDRHPTS